MQAYVEDYFGFAYNMRGWILLILVGVLPTLLLSSHIRTAGHKPDIVAKESRSAACARAITQKPMQPCQPVVRDD